MLNQEIVQRAAAVFLDSKEGISIASLGNGLIHHTYRISCAGETQKIVLQAINTHIFTSPADIVNNYNDIFEYLRLNNNDANIPAPIHTKTGELLWIDEEKNCWRAYTFIDHSYSPMNAVNEDAAYTVSKSFAGFTQSLSGLDPQQLKEIIPGFHDLIFRYKQFEEAIARAPADRLLKSTHIIAQLRQRKGLIAFYESIQNAPGYPERVMHHDCKISNILFDTDTNRVICPVDFDTTMPGKFFSDLGDMIRTMACSVDENNTDWEDIAIRPSFYQSILKGYLEGIGNIFTEEEKKNIHFSGLLLTFMQTLRFISDYLNGDTYYKTTYHEQNLNRALNQLILLERLEAFLKEEYNFVN